MDANVWLAGATSVYAAGTLLLAWVTARSSSKQLRAAAETTDKQIGAGKEAARIEGHTAAVSKSRQGWINQLRNEVTGFLTEAGMRTALENDVNHFTEAFESERVAVLRSMKSHLNKVRLLINPTEGESTQLVEMLSSLYNREKWGDEFEDEIVSHTQAILKAEWERVKLGE